MLKSHIFWLAENDSAMLQILRKKRTTRSCLVRGINNYLEFRHLVSLQMFWFAVDSNSMMSMIFLTKIMPTPPFFFSLITWESCGTSYSKILKAFPESLISKIIFCLSLATFNWIESRGLQAWEWIIKLAQTSSTARIIWLVLISDNCVS